LIINDDLNLTNLQVELEMEKVVNWQIGDVTVENPAKIQRWPLFRSRVDLSHSPNMGGGDLRTFNAILIKKEQHNKPLEAFISIFNPSANLTSRPFNLGSFSRPRRSIAMAIRKVAG